MAKTLQDIFALIKERVIDLPENRPFDQYPRNVAIRALDYMKELGIADEMLIGPEYEFYIFDGVSFENSQHSSGYRLDVHQAHWIRQDEVNNSGFQIEHGRGYHTSLPMDINNDLRSRICLQMDEWGIDVKYHHHEVGGCGQMEVEVELGEMLTLADATMAAK